MNREPKLQNIPLWTKLGKQLKEIFERRTPIKNPDYSELEERVLRYTNDECDPPRACETHGRCWTHSKWDDER